MPTFRMVDLVRDRDLLDLAHREAARCLEVGAGRPADVARLLEGWESRFRLIEVG